MAQWREETLLLGHYVLVEVGRQFREHTGKADIIIECLEQLRKCMANVVVLFVSIGCGLSSQSSFDDGVHCPFFDFHVCRQRVDQFHQREIARLAVRITRAFEQRFDHTVFDDQLLEHIHRVSSVTHERVPRSPSEETEVLCDGLLVVHEDDPASRMINRQLLIDQAREPNALTSQNRSPGSVVQRDEVS